MAWCRTRGGWCCSSLHSSVWHSDRCISLKNCPAMPSRPDKTHINYPQLQSIYQWCGSSCRRWSSLPLQCTSTKSAGTATLVGPTSQSHGQCIEPPKSCATVYTWHPDKKGILQIAPSPPLPTPITLAENNAPTLININKMSDGVRYLGVYITRDRNTKPMEANLWKKALTYTAAFQWPWQTTMKWPFYIDLVLCQLCLPITSNLATWPLLWQNPLSLHINNFEQDGLPQEPTMVPCVCTKR